MATELAEAIAPIFNSTSDAADGLRDTVFAALLAPQSKLLEHPEMQMAVQAVEGLALELLLKNRADDYIPKIWCIACSSGRVERCVKCDFESLECRTWDEGSASMYQCLRCGGREAAGEKDSDEEGIM